MSGSVTVRRFSSLPEAMACVSYLTAHDIEAVLGEYHHATVQWYLIPALGGLSVKVPASQAQVARELLHVIETEDTGSETAAGYELPRSYGRLGAILFLLAPAGLIVIPLTLIAIPLAFAVAVVNQSEQALLSSWDYAEALGHWTFALFTTAALIFICLDAKRFMQDRAKEKPEL